jgi:hypothetical protein
VAEAGLSENAMARSLLGPNPPPLAESGTVRRSLLAIAGLSLLLFALDRLYRVLHPHVDIERASLVGLTALAALAPLRLLRRRPIEPWAGALAIFVSAFVSVLSIEAGVLVSQSALSGAVHVAILAVVFPVVDRICRAAPSRALRPGA